MAVPPRSRSVPQRLILIGGLALAGLTVNPPAALACACCTDPGYRRVSTEPLNGYVLDEIRRIRFEESAFVYVGAGDVDSIEGIEKASELYTVTVMQDDAGITLSFKDDKSGGGALTLKRPATVSIFEVDPRETDEPGGFGPKLYKELSLSGPASGTGAFAEGVKGGATMTLIFHGQGLACMSADEFTAWTLVVTGPNGDYSLLGRLRKLK